MFFQTQRLRIRVLTEADFPAFHEMQSNPRVMRYTTGVAMTELESRASLEMCIRSYAEPGNNFWVWAVERKSDRAFAGTAAIVGEGHEIGYRFLEKYWGNGYGQEVCDGLIEFALNEWKLTSRGGGANTDNIASVKILERSRLHFEREYFHEKEKSWVRVYRLEV